jgi:hypothetical protein
MNMHVASSEAYVDVARRPMMSPCCLGPSFPASHRRSRRRTIYPPPPDQHLRSIRTTSPRPPSSLWITTNVLTTRRETDLIISKERWEDQSTNLKDRRQAHGAINSESRHEGRHRYGSKVETDLFAERRSHHPNNAPQQIKPNYKRKERVRSPLQTSEVFSWLVSFELTFKSLRQRILRWRNYFKYDATVFIKRMDTTSSNKYISIL